MNISEKQYFVGIGAQKAGTSWIADYLQNHPQVAFSPIKELHYFDCVYRPDLFSIFNDKFKKQLQANIERINLNDVDSDLIEECHCLLKRLTMIKNPMAYRDYFNDLIRIESKAFGEITPAYAFLKTDGFQKILNLYPNAKFIFILRNPCDRYWSQLCYAEMRSINEKRSHFSAYNNLEKMLTSEKFYLRTDYTVTLRELRQVAKKENILILFYEKLFDSKYCHEEIEKLCLFLGIDNISPEIGRKINVTDKQTLHVEQREKLFLTFKHIYEEFHLIYGNQLPLSWREDLEFYS